MIAYQVLMFDIRDFGGQICKSLNKFTRGVFGDGDWLNFIMEGGNMRYFQCLIIRKSSTKFKGPMFDVEIKRLVISNSTKPYKEKKFGDGFCKSCLIAHN